MKMLEDLFLDALADMYYCEQQLVKALPKIAKAATQEKAADAKLTKLGQERSNLSAKTGEDMRMAA